MNLMLFSFEYSFFEVFLHSMSMSVVSNFQQKSYKKSRNNTKQVNNNKKLKRIRSKSKLETDAQFSTHSIHGIFCTFCMCPISYLVHQIQCSFSCMASEKKNRKHKHLSPCSSVELEASDVFQGVPFLQTLFSSFVYR